MISESLRNVKLIADLTIFSRGSVLLVRYSDSNAYDHQTGWFLPDDLVSQMEHPRDAARRIASDQLGIQVGDVELADLESFTGNDGSWHLAFHYRIALDETPPLTPSEDIADVKWFGRENLPPRSEVAHGGWALSTIETLSPAFVQ